MFWILMTVLMLACLAFLVLEYRSRQQAGPLSPNFRRLFWTYVVTLILFLVIGLPVANYPVHTAPADPDTVAIRLLKEMRQEIQENFKSLHKAIQDSSTR
ncbi:MAG: hypothetical protein EOM25_04935 [Deltaproteobacteria bacterium]|nr:hypothetical protein [Deltaproteobacteria bacterium]